jgi:hypothetical protein
LEDTPPEEPEVIVEELPPGAFEEARKKIEDASPAAIPQLPPVPSCTVPKLAGMTLVRAEAALRGAHCRLGKVTKPKTKKGHKPPALVVKSSTPGTGARSASGTVNLTLGPKPKKHHH